MARLSQSRYLLSLVARTIASDAVGQIMTISLTVALIGGAWRFPPARMYLLSFAAFAFVGALGTAAYRYNIHKYDMFIVRSVRSRLVVNDGGAKVMFETHRKIRARQSVGQVYAFYLAWSGTTDIRTLLEPTQPGFTIDTANVGDGWVRVELMFGTPIKRWRTVECGVRMEFPEEEPFKPYLSHHAANGANSICSHLVLEVQHDDTIVFVEGETRGYEHKTPRRARMREIHPITNVPYRRLDHDGYTLRYDVWPAQENYYRIDFPYAKVATANAPMGSVVNER